MIDEQIKICFKYNAKYQFCDMRLKVGISRSVKTGDTPVHGLRVKEENGTSGWYIWSGEWSSKDDFFVPLHGEHIIEWAPFIIPYLGLSEGWRFLVDNNGYEDVWEDKSLLK